LSGDGRVLQEPNLVPEAGADPVPFNYDWSGNYYRLAYETPGPEISIYSLNGEGCA
jgi:hypothetical protein